MSILALVLILVLMSILVINTLIKCIDTYSHLLIV